MTNTTKDASAEKVQVDKTLTESSKLKRAIISAITSKGYAVGDMYNVRDYSLNKTNNELINFSNHISILEDSSETSKNIAQSGIPVLRLLRGKANVLANLHYKVDSINDWSMTIYGEKNVDGMVELGKELFSKHGMNIKIKTTPELKKESLLHPAYYSD